MSKKPQNKENPKNKPQIVDQQNEPFLKVLAKKVRNINKKLAEIAELEVKENLKPEQVEKISRKAALAEQRTKVEDIATLFKESYAENIQVYRANQLKELDVLARALALHHAGIKIPESGRLAQLWNAVEQSSDSSKTINESVTVIGNALKDFASDKKLQKNLGAFVELHGNDKREQQVATTEKQRIVAEILNEKPEPKQQVVEEPPKKQQHVPVAVVEVPVAKVEAVAKVEPVPVVVAEPAQVIVKVEQETTPLQQNLQSQNEEKPINKEDRRDYKKHEYKDRGGYKGNRGDNRGENRGGNRGDNRGEKREGDGEKRQYRPKYAEKQQERQANDPKKEESSSDSEEERVRTFRRDEIKQLENEGFTVIKQKPKPKDPRENRQFHDREHGNKQKHHQNSQK